MLIQTNMQIVYIYDHEEDYQAYIDFLTNKCQKDKLTRGFRFLLDASTFKEFIDTFDIVGFDNEKIGR